MKIPANLDDELLKVLEPLVGQAVPRYLAPVGGGCINECIHMRAGSQDFFLKYNQRVRTGMFAAEADGLQRLAEARIIRVPQVFAVSEGSETAPAFLLLEWIDQNQHLAQSILGESLANLHEKNTSSEFGLDQDGYIGSNPQDNGWMVDWIDFFRERRLRPQMEMAVRLGLLNRQRRTQLEKLMENLNKWLAGVDHQPALLHGDLWGGNVIAADGGQPVLIDPAVYYGDREAELAFTRLFGGFHHEFYQAYQSVAALEPGFEDRFQIYNLYHLLNHLNLFGEGYGSQIDDILRRFVG